MAVNKITNKGVVNRELVNRANEVSTKGTTIRGNRETTIIPGNNFADNYSITLKDVDTAVLNHVKNVMKPRVREANETFKIPVYYGNEERWKAVRSRGVLRDKNGSLLLPYYNELMKVHKYKKKPIMGPPSTNPAKLLKFEQIYNRNGYPDDGKDARKAAVEYRYGIKEKPDNTPIISRKAVNNLVQDAMIKYIDEIVMYQNNALVEYEKSLESAITGMYVSH